MKLKEKIFIIIALTWIIFLGYSTLIIIRASSIPFFALTLCFAIASIVLIHFLIINRLEALIKKVSEASDRRDKIQQIELKGDDEISLLATKINALLERAQKREIAPQPIEIRNEALSRLSHYDTLTSLPNRIFFNEILNKAMNHAKRHKTTCAILMINLDGFKKINAKVGSNAGDQLLKEIGNRFIKTLRSEDILARLDADEFIVLLNSIEKPKFASAVAEKLLAATSAPLVMGSQTFSIKASIGICIYPNDATSLEDLLKNADSALDKVKRAGGNAYQFFTQALDIEGHEFIQLEKALRKAIQRDELVLYYQPKLHIKKGNISGVEALIRWIHPELGVINPAKLILLAEETGLIMQIGEWALREACRVNKYWQDEGYEHMTVAVNLSPKQFHHPDIAKIITKVLKETELDPNYLEVEINETAIMGDVNVAIPALEKIKATGIKITIDHFGTGYTSISHLKQFPISAVKLDQIFIKGLPNDPNDLAITNALIALAHNLGLEVVAEGVETAEQVQYLAGENCDMVQGYFLSHPLPAQKIVGQFRKLEEEVLI